MSNLDYEEDLSEFETGDLDIDDESLNAGKKVPLEKGSKPSPKGNKKPIGSSSVALMPGWRRRIRQK